MAELLLYSFITILLCNKSFKADLGSIENAKVAMLYSVVERCEPLPYLPYKYTLVLATI